MPERESPLGTALRPGSHGNFADGIGVTLSEQRPGSIVQVAAWPGEERALLAAVKSATGLVLPDGAGGGLVKAGKGAFGFAPGRFLVVDEEEGLAAKLSAAVAAETGTVTDLSHGRTAIRAAGPKAEWVLAKFFAIDFALPAFPMGSGRSTVHHDIFAMIQRTGEEQFDIYLFRSFARSFWTALCHGAEEVGYQVA
ncbi:sarcosine oxidase subunit gamma [Mesorhizobium sp. J18]|uniref:sarcosine oxidase subunit gamma family protein n=1 Tax=Mesorhizobium sp. J18 TaxID=935263 RepID=UPI0011997F8A|nr:sarcosine oxidase subunit gamma [Mesorhizobium sp. J18]TWH01127.1 sarcosine oxidase subunit gamma [Mesorhizobium sp. J18]